MLAHMKCIPEYGCKHNMGIIIEELGIKHGCKNWATAESTMIVCHFGIISAIL